MKCPDKQILSLYYDGELPAKFARVVEAHLVVCEECRERLAEFGRLSAALRGGVPDDAVIEAAKARVFAKLPRTVPPHHPRHFAPATLFTRRVRLPLPAAAAAALLFVGSVGAAFYMFATPHNSGAISIAHYVDDYEPLVQDKTKPTTGVAPADDMSNILRYVDNSNDDVLDLKLPQTGKFLNIGEAKLIHAASNGRERAR
jgi:hypothetical protein